MWLKEKLTGSSPYERAVRLLILATVMFAFASHLTLPLLTLYPMENLGLQFAASSYIYGAYGTIASSFSILVSPAVDRLPSLLLSAAAGVAAASLRFALPFIGRLWPVPSLLVTCALLPVFDVLVMVPMYIALKRIVTAEYAGRETEIKPTLDTYVYVTYSLTNGVDVVVNLLYDTLRHVTTPELANDVSIWLAAVTITAGSMLLMVVKRMTGAADIAFYDQRQSPWALMFRGGRWKRFVRFMAMCTLLIGVRMVFRHLDLTLAVFLLRSIGTSAHFPIVQSVNPAVVVLLALFMPHLLRRFLAAKGARDGSETDYSIIVGGTSISAAGPVVLALTLATLAAYGLQSHEWAVSLASAGAILIFSVGEAVWCPRYASYAIQIAPEGTEAVYTALATIPALAVKLPTSYLSEVLIDTYCTALGACRGEFIWAWIGGIAFLSPALLFGLQSVLREKDRVNNTLHHH